MKNFHKKMTQPGWKNPVDLFCQQTEQLSFLFILVLCTVVSTGVLGHY